eukprot:TRINITY_DN53971_c0_g1_i1.p1 TRINITY_DN53971_c0_g1~~TRINITY_DN53971_c0_g1_i1.p1  ORF type:complete len:508 (-),score=2.59 TRINITY_DN53971_c0_g1_i1:221-1744(-)
MEEEGERRFSILVECDRWSDCTEEYNNPSGVEPQTRETTGDDVVVLHTVPSYTPRRTPARACKRRNAQYIVISPSPSPARKSRKRAAPYTTPRQRRRPSTCSTDSWVPSPPTPPTVSRRRTPHTTSRKRKRRRTPPKRSRLRKRVHVVEDDDDDILATFVATPRQEPPRPVSGQLVHEDSPLPLQGGQPSTPPARTHVEPTPVARRLLFHTTGLISPPSSPPPVNRCSGPAAIAAPSQHATATTPARTPRRRNENTAHETIEIAPTRASKGESSSQQRRITPTVVRASCSESESGEAGRRSSTGSCLMLPIVQRYSLGCDTAPIEPLPTPAIPDGIVVVPVELAKRRVVGLMSGNGSSGRPSSMSNRSNRRSNCTPSRADKQRESEATGRQSCCLSSLQLSLTCPLSLKPIVLPARGKHCTHLQTFDLTVFLQLLGKSPRNSLKCPLCSLRLRFDGLVVDLYVSEIIQTLNASAIRRGRLNKCTMVELLPDGSWRAPRQQSVVYVVD